MNSILEEKDVIVKGCDVWLDPKLKNNSQFFEGTIIDALSQLLNNSSETIENKENGCIDLFYWNDVLEHILDDEIDEHIRLIRKNMCENGILVTITPNRLVGPCDITQLFYPFGTKAQGFHFHEYSYFEVKKLFESHGFLLDQSVLVNPLHKNCYIFPISSFYTQIIEGIKFCTETITPILYPIKLRRILLQCLGTHITIFKKIS